MSTLVVCYHCGERTRGGTRCEECGRGLDRRVAQELETAARLEQSIREEEHLNRGLRSQLLLQIQSNVSVELARAKDADAEWERVEAEHAVREDVAEPSPSESERDPARDPADAGAASEATPRQRSPFRRRPERRPSPAHNLLARLGPAFGENLLFTLAAFLLVGGAVFFVTTAWTTMTGTARLLAVFGGLGLFGSLSHAAGRMLNRGGGLHEVERTLTLVTALLVPVAGAVAGRLLLAAWPMGVVAVAITVVAGRVVLRDAARQQHPALVGVLSNGTIGLSALAALTPLLALGPGIAGVVVAAVLIALAQLAVARVPVEFARRSSYVYVCVVLLGFAGLVTVAGAALGSSLGLLARLAPIGTALAAVGWSLVRFEQILVTTGRASIGLASIVGLACALTGCGIATAEPRMLLVAAGVTAWASIEAALHLDRSALLWPGLVLSGVTYFLLPAPVREFALEVRAWFAGSLGYAPERLPISFYGVTFLPYTAGLGLFAAWLRRRGREAFSSTTLGWMLAVATSLASLAILAGSDARAPTAVLGAEGSILVLLGAITRRQRLLFAGMLGVYGGLACGLVHLAAAHAWVALAFGTASFVAMLTARRLQSDVDSEAFGWRASVAILDATAIAAVLAGGYVALPLGQAFAAHGAFELLGYGALAAAIGLVALVYRAAWLNPFAWLVGGCGLYAAAGDLGPRSMVWFAALSFLPILVGRVGWRPGLRREGLLPQTAGSTWPNLAAVVVMQLFMLPALFVHLRVWPEVSGFVGLALAIAAVVVAAGSVAYRAHWGAVVASAYVIVGSLTAAAGLGLEPGGEQGAAALGCAALVLAATSCAARRSEAVGAVFSPLGAAGLGVGVLVMMWWVGLRLDVGATWPPRFDALASLVATVAVFGAGVLGVLRARSSLAARFSGGLAVSALPSVAISLVDALQLRAGWYPVAFIVAACIGRTIPGRDGARIAVIHLLLALAAAVLVAGQNLAGDGVLILAFAALAVVARFAVGEFPVVRTLCVLVGGLGAVWFTVTQPPIGLGPEWLPAIAIGFGALAGFAPRWRWAGVEERGLTLFVAPIGFAGVAFGLFCAAWLLRDGQVADGTLGPRFAAGLALAVLGVSRGLGAVGFGRHAWSLSLGLAACFVFPFVSVWLPDRYVLPDIELALVGLAWAARSRIATAGVAYAVVTLAVLSTGFRLWDWSTPLTASIAACVPLALWRGRAGSRQVLPFGLATLVVGLSWTSFALPWSMFESQSSASVLALVAASVSAGWCAFETVAHRRARADFAPAGRVAWISSVVALLLVAHFAVWARRGDVPMAVVVAACVACVTVAGVGVRRAQTIGVSRHVYLSIAALLCLYVVFTNATWLLDSFDGFHLHLVVLFGAGLLFGCQRARPAIAAPMRNGGLALPLPAVLIAGHAPSLDGALALLLGAAVYGYGSMVLGIVALRWVAAALLNGALFSLWWHNGWFEPAFYGVPAGLTLVVGSEFVRRGMRMALWTSGLSVLYGSLAVQVFRVEQPVHALGLLAAALAAVAIGFVRRRNDYLLAGTAAVVLDVVGYLARNGLERDFVGAGLLVAAGVTVLVAAVTARRRREAEAPTLSEPGQSSG